MKTNTYPDGLRFTQFETRRRETVDWLNSRELESRTRERTWRLRISARRHQTPV